jgi:hypothetical protein
MKDANAMSHFGFSTTNTERVNTQSQKIKESTFLFDLHIYTANIDEMILG